MKKKYRIIPLLFLTVFISISINTFSADNVPVYSVYELTFKGKTYTVKDNPVRDIELLSVWQHEQSLNTIPIYGFYDGDGQGSKNGAVFKVRFCPMETGTWTLIQVRSNDRDLNRQHQGLKINAIASDHPGFWEVDNDSPGNRWYKRSNGSHQYIAGNTMYSFLSEYYKGDSTGGNIRDDIINNSGYFKKVRLAVTGDRYPNPVSKPFLNENGEPTDDGNYCHRPNPEWFNNRVDLAVKTAFEKDLITDLILNGPDAPDSRTILKATKNNSDPGPFLRYIAARYGSFPNVWLCISNEYDIQTPNYNCDEMIRAGQCLQDCLPYSTPVSVHASSKDWDENLNTAIPWFDHVIIQNKLKKSDQSADKILWNYFLGGANQPVVNDELAYEGNGDGWTEEDVIEAFLGAFMGGGYASTGHKPANKDGHYFSGNFKPSEHTAADNLNWFREMIDKNITFWKMKPVAVTNVTGNNAIIFRNHDMRHRIMMWEDNEYVIAGSSAKRGIKALLPEGSWTVKSYDLISRKETVISENAEGNTNITIPDSRAFMVHFKKNGQR